MTPELFTEKMEAYKGTDEGKANVERAKRVSQKGAELIRFGMIYFPIYFTEFLLNIIYFSIDLACL